MGCWCSWNLTRTLPEDDSPDFSDTNKTLETIFPKILEFKEHSFLSLLVDVIRSDGGEARGRCLGVFLSIALIPGQFFKSLSAREVLVPITTSNRLQLLLVLKDVIREDYDSNFKLINEREGEPSSRACEILWALAEHANNLVASSLVCSAVYNDLFMILRAAGSDPSLWIESCRERNIKILCFYMNLVSVSMDTVDDMSTPEFLHFMDELKNSNPTSANEVIRLQADIILLYLKETEISLNETNFNLLLDIFENTLEGKPPAEGFNKGTFCIKLTLRIFLKFSRSSKNRNILFHGKISHRFFELLEIALGMFAENKLFIPACGGGGNDKASASLAIQLLRQFYRPKEHLEVYAATDTAIVDLMNKCFHRDLDEEDEEKCEFIVQRVLSFRTSKVPNEPELALVPENDDNSTVKFYRWDKIDVDSPNLSDHQIGEGSFSKVYKVFLVDRAGRHAVALKVFHDEKNDYKTVLSNARKEAEIISKVTSSIVMKDSVVSLIGIVCGNITSKLAGFSTNQNVVAIITRLEAGGSLEHVLYPPLGRIKPTLNETMKVGILRGVMELLKALHAVGCVHGDVKPANVLFGNSENRPDCVRLADFGLSDMKEELECSINQNVMKSTFKTKGTRIYCAPEMITNPYNINPKVAKASFKTDMYAFAVLAWELLSESKPFDGLNEIELASKVHKNDRPSVDVLYSKSIRPELIQMITKCWDVDPAKRLSAEYCYTILDEVYTRFREKSFDIFFSHTWTDKGLLRNVHRALVSQGYRVWYDENEMGWDLVKSMKDGIEMSKVVLCCLNHKYQARPNCMLELTETVKTYPDKKVVSLLLDKFNLRDNVWVLPDGSVQPVSAELTANIDLTNFKYVDISQVAKDPVWYPASNDPDDAPDKPTPVLLKALEPLLKNLEEIFVQQNSARSSSSQVNALLPSAVNTKKRRSKSP